MLCTCRVVKGYRIVIDSPSQGEVLAEARGPSSVSPHAAMHAVNGILKAGVESLMADLVMKAQANAVLN